MDEQNYQSNGPQVSEQKADPAGFSSGGNSNDIKENKAIAYLSYLGILFLVPLLAKKDSKFAVFHAKQGLIIFIGWFVGSFMYVLFGLGFLIHLVMIVFSVMGLMNVHNEKMKDLPLIGDFAKKINI